MRLTKNRLQWLSQLYDELKFTAGLHNKIVQGYSTEVDIVSVGWNEFTYENGHGAEVCVPFSLILDNDWEEKLRQKLWEENLRAVEARKFKELIQREQKEADERILYLQLKQKYENIL